MQFKKTEYIKYLSGGLVYEAGNGEPLSDIMVARINYKLISGEVDSIIKFKGVLK